MAGLDQDAGSRRGSRAGLGSRHRQCGIPDLLRMEFSHGRQLPILNRLLRRLSLGPWTRVSASAIWTVPLRDLVSPSVPTLAQFPAAIRRPRSGLKARFERPARYHDRRPSTQSNRSSESCRVSSTFPMIGRTGRWRARRPGHCTADLRRTPCASRPDRFRADRMARHPESRSAFARGGGLRHPRHSDLPGGLRCTRLDPDSEGSRLQPPHQIRHLHDGDCQGSAHLDHHQAAGRNAARRRPSGHQQGARRPRSRSTSRWTTAR